MAKVKGGIGLELSGKVAGVVFVQLNGSTYMRSAPRRKKNSWSPNQVRSQQRFGQINSFCGKFKYSVIPAIWNGVSERMSGYALFLKSNMPAFAPDGSLADPKLIRMSTGQLALPPGLTAGKPEGNGSLIEVSWQKDLQIGGVHLRDELIVVSAGEGNYSDILETGILRVQLNGSFELPQLPSPATHIYLFFGSRDHRDYSESVCFEL